MSPNTFMMEFKKRVQPQLDIRRSEIEEFSPVYSSKRRLSFDQTTGNED
jgi:hypothetical protein